MKRGHHCLALSLLLLAQTARAAEPAPAASPTATPRANEITPTGAMWRSAVLPGWGQRYKGERKKGWVHTAVFGVLAAGAAGAFVEKDAANRSYDHLSNGASNSAFDSAYQRDLQATFAADIMGSATAAFWAYSIGEAGFRGVDPLRLRDARVKDVFPAAAKYYEDNPFASVTVENRSGEPITNIRVRVEAPEVMSAPAEAAAVDSLAPGLAREIQVRAAFSDRVFDVGNSEARAVPARVVVEYEAKHKKKQLERTATFTVYGRNAIVWDDIRKLGSFVTPREQSVTSFVSDVVRRRIAVGGSKNVAEAAVFFDAMSAAGITYLSDPQAPFAQFEGNAAAVDSVSFPHETLARRTGDCDDLTALYASLLESAGIPAALVDVPGHVYVMFDSGLKPEEFKRQLDSDRFVVRGADAWVPVEITALGKPFATAWQTASDESRKWIATSRLNAVDVLDAQETFPPTVPSFSSSPATPIDDKVLASLAATDRDRLAGAQSSTLARAIAAIQARKLAADVEANEIGIEYAHAGKLPEATRSFQRAMQLNPKNGRARNNLANVAWASGDRPMALHYYLQALDALGEDPGVLINLAQAYLEMGDRAAAARYYDRARKADASYAALYADLADLVHSDTATASGKNPTAPQNAARAGTPEKPAEWLPRR